MKSSFSPNKSKKEIYQEKYEASKQGGETFFPDTLVRDAIVALFVVLVIVTLAIVFRAPLEAPADPTSLTYNPRPEWYFLFFFEFLKLFPGWLEPVAAAIIPIVAVLLLMIIPFLDRGLERRWSRRKAMLGAGVLVVLILVVLEVLGAMSAPAVPAGEQAPLVQAGREVYRERNCSYCHSIHGVGSNIGPELGNIGGELSDEQIATYLENPDLMVPETLHPKFLFTPEELDALVAYLSTLGEQVSYSPQAVELYQENCSACHIINGEGGALGPELSTVGERRSLAFLEDFIRDPKAVLPGATMPSYKDSLTPEQIQDIAAYLYSLKGSSSSP
jgi:sulfur oxidation c-type cytochrome SoxX